MASTPAVELLAKCDCVYRLHSYKHDPTSAAFGTEAASVLSLDASRVFKTLIAEADGQLVVALVSVAHELDLRSLARSLGAKRAIMATPAVAERASGYVVGGISPLGQRRQLTTLIDESAKDSTTVFVSGGRRGLEIEIDPVDLAKLTKAQFASIARGH